MPGFTVKKKGKKAPAQRQSYPVETCRTAWKDAESGQWTSPPKKEGSRAQLRKGKSGADVAIVTRWRDDSGEVTGARVTLPAARAAQRKGKLKKAQVREMERDLSRDALEAFNPRLAEQLGHERMREAHNSHKATRAAATRKAKKAAGIGKKSRPVDTIRADLMRAQQALEHSRLRHTRAKTPGSREKYADTINTRRRKIAALQAELKRAGGS